MAAPSNAPAPGPAPAPTCGLLEQRLAGLVVGPCLLQLLRLPLQLRLAQHQLLPHRRQVGGRQRLAAARQRRLQRRCLRLLQHRQLPLQLLVGRLLLHHHVSQLVRLLLQRWGRRVRVLEGGSGWRRVG